jgi:hypothetical protein
MTFSGNPYSRCRTCSKVFLRPAAPVIGLAKGWVSTIEPFRGSDMK